MDEDRGTFFNLFFTTLRLASMATVATFTPSKVKVGAPISGQTQLLDFPSTGEPSLGV